MSDSTSGSGRSISSGQTSDNVAPWASIPDPAGHRRPPAGLPVSHLQIDVHPWSAPEPGAVGRTSYHPVMKTSGITVALPAQDLGRAKAFYVEKVGLQALESQFLKARDGQVGLTVGDGVSQLFVYPARVRSSGEFTQAVIHVTDVRAAVEEMRGRGVEFEEYDTPETRTENGVARMPGGGEAAWFKDSEGNLVGVVPA
jgi:predicted enzyme related to lactoylglutathione lyase